MDACIVGSWAKVPNGEDGIEMAENVFLNRDNIAPIPIDKHYLTEFREKHPNVKAALVNGIEYFDDQYFGTGESEAICMDPQQRMLMQGVIQALQNAGVTIKMASEARVAVYTAAWCYDYKDLLSPDQYMATGNSASVMCGRITYFLNSRGAAVGIETACSSSLVAFHLARQAIQIGETKLALVCGANHVGSRSFDSLYNSHMISPNGRLAAFDRSANGFVRAEAFAVAVLSSRQFAEEHNLQIHAECIGSAFNSDGKTPSLTAPNPVSQYEVQLAALENIDPDIVQLVTCHGTGTKLGDQVELTAIKKSFKSDIRVMSPKSSMGHGEGAAGLIGILQSLYSMQKGIVPNQLHLQLPSEDLGEEKSMGFVNEEMDLKRIAISSYGFGGTNACAIIAEPKTTTEKSKSYAESDVLFLSAKSHESLKLQIEEYTTFLAQSDSNFEDILYTVNERKTKYDIRAAVFGKNREEMVRKLQNGEYSLTNSREGTFEVEFGEGNEKLWLLRMLYEKNEAFHSAVDKYCKLAEFCGFPEARAALFFPFKLTLTPLTYNVSLLISSMATFDLLVQYKTLPSKLRGKGLGHIFCLAAAKVITFESAVQLIKGVVAEADLTEIINHVNLKPSKVLIEIQHLNKSMKKILPTHIFRELKETAKPNLMTFIVNQEEILELDPIIKVQKLICQLFVSGLDPVVNFRGQIVKTPGYSFLKRRFWPEQSKSVVTAKFDERKERSISIISSSEIESAVRGIVKQFLDIEDDTVSLLEAGVVDSLTSIEMIEALGSAVNQTMPFDLLETYPTIREIIRFLNTFANSVTSKSTSRTTSIPKTTGNVSIATVDINVIATDFMFAGIEGEKEMWDALLTSRLVTGKMSETRKKQCEGDPGLEVGLLKQDISLFDNSFFSIAKDESEFVDPQHRLLLHSAYNALEKSGLLAIPEADLFLAINSHSEYRALAEKHLEELDERLWMGTVHSMAAGRLAALMGIRGRVVIVDTTCSSIASALEMAVNSIRNGKQYAVVATSQLIQSSKWLYSLRTLLDGHNTKSFSMDRAGFCRSDGVGVIILEAANTIDSAIIKISYAKSHYSGVVITPVVSAISQLLEEVGDVSYIEGHGTATSAGDSSESLCYQKLENEFIMSSVKAQFGHSEVASGLIQLMKVASLSKNGIIPAIVHNCLPNEHVRNNDKIRLPFVSEEQEIERSAIVSFGITGTKTVVATEKIIQTNAVNNYTCYLLPISAKTRDALKKSVSNLVEMIEKTKECLYNISTTLQKQKTNFKWRAFVVGKNHSEVLRNLKTILAKDQTSIFENWHVCTKVHSIGCASFFNNIPYFEEQYTMFCHRLRFDPHSNVESIYHLLAVMFAFIKTILKHNTSTSFAVGGFNALIVLAAVDAAPSHYLNDLLHAFANNDVRMMKRIARDVTINIENVELFNLKGEPITTARNAVDATIDTETTSARFSEDTLVLSPNEKGFHTKCLQNIRDYFEFVGDKFTKGSKIDFAEVFGKPNKLIDLPEYPFKRNSFWLPIADKNKSIQFENQIATKPSSYEFLLNSDKWRHVRSHVIDSEIVLPGATSIRLVHQLYSKPSAGLSNIDFLNKITPSETPVVVKLVEQNEATTLLFGETEAISFNIANSKDFNIIPNEQLNSEVLRSDDIYQRFSTSHLIYRNKFQMIEYLKYTMGKGEAQFVEINDLDILIDGTLQAIVGCYYFENISDHSPFVPFTIEELYIVNEDFSQMQLHAVFTYAFTENFITGNATVYDLFGNVILHISNVIFKRMDGPSSSFAASKTVDTSKIIKKVEDENLKRESKNMLHVWFEEHFGWTDIDNTTGFFDLGLTSIQAVKLRNHIKANYPNASSTCVFDYPTIELLSGYISTLSEPIVIKSEENRESEEKKEDSNEHITPTRLAENPIGVLAAACRLPGGVTSPAELWELLKIGKNASSRIPASRVMTRNTLISGLKYGNSVEGGNFITQDVSQFDPAFFKISKSEAELIDPQQRILLECVQECLENSGVTETSSVGVFVGLMEKEYQDMMESSSILSMLGSMSAVIAGRVNYVFGCYGPSVTIDTACSSSLVALEMAINALLDKRCSKAIVAGVNLILNEKGQGLRANGKMLSQHGMSLSFDSRASGYGRSDGCVVIMLELAKPNFHYMSTIKSMNVNHGGRSVSLTAPNGVAHKMLITAVINQSPSLSIDYWEAHGTGTPLGDPIEFNILSSILQNIIIGSVKSSLGHGEASAGTCGLLKLFLMLTYQYVPSIIHFHVLNKDINSRSIRLPVIGEDAELVSGGISSFGVSGTNAAAIAFNDNYKLEPYTAIHKYYILPISAKNQTSLHQLEQEILSVIPLTDVSICNIASTLANNRFHFTIRNALIVSHSGTVISKMAGKPHRVAKRDRFYVKIGEGILDARLLQYAVINEMYTVTTLRNTQLFAMKFAIIKFLTCLSEFVEIVASDSEELLAILLANGSLKWETFQENMFDLPASSLLNELADQNLNSTTSSAVKSYHTQPEALKLDSHMDVLQLIVYLYIVGYDVDWSSVYPPVEQFVALPNYQFNKQTIWFEEREVIVDHYLIGTIEEETDDCLTLKNQLSELRHPQFFKGKPLDVGTMSEIAIEALKIQNEIPFSIQKLKTEQVSLTKPAWLKTTVKKEEEDEGFIVSAYIDDKNLFTLSAAPIILDSIELPAVEVQIPNKVVYLKECPNAVVRRQRNLIYVDSRAEPSPFRTANIVLNEIIGFAPTPSDMFIEILGVLPSVYYMVQVDDGALWQFQMISQDKQLLSNIYVLKDAKGLEIPIIRMHKKSTLLSSQEASLVAPKTLQMTVRSKVCLAVSDVIDSLLEIDESQMSTGFSELGMDSLATVDLLNRLNQKYFPEIELTTSDLFDNPNIVDLSIMIEELLIDKGITEVSEASEVATHKISIRERKMSIPAVRAQELAQIEFVGNYNAKKKEEKGENKMTTGDVDIKDERTDIRRKISSVICDLSSEALSAADIKSRGFTELGLDSLSIVDLVNRLNNEYFPGYNITASDVFDYPTVDDLTDHIASMKSSSMPYCSASENGEIQTVITSSEIEKAESKSKEELLTQSYILMNIDNNSIKYDFILVSAQRRIQLTDSKGALLFELNEDGGQEKDLRSYFYEVNKILIQLDDYENSVEILFMSLLNFIISLSKRKIKCHFEVSQKFSVGNSIARAFMKTVASEKYPLISFGWDQKIQQVSFEPCDIPISGNWLISGGLSGIGFEIGKFLANEGAEKIVLISRRQPTEQIVKEVETWKAEVHTIAADITDKKTLIGELTRLNIHITGIIHSAGVLKDFRIERQDKNTFNHVFKPKGEGLMVLEEIEKHFKYKIKHFIMMSSFTAACGNEGQLNYGVANAYLEYHVQRRRREGKSGCAIQWGNWLDTGMATSSQVQKFLANIGFLGQHNKDALKYLQACIHHKPELIMVANIDWNAILKNRQDLSRDLFFTEILPFKSFAVESKECEYSKIVLNERADNEEVSTQVTVDDEEEVLELLREKVCSIVKCSPNKLKSNKNIMDIGLDSRLLMEFLNFVNATFTTKLNLSDIYIHSTLEQLASHIFENITIVEERKGEAPEELAEIKKTSPDFCPIFGVNVFLDSKEELNETISEAISLLEKGTPLKSNGKFAVSVVGTSIPDVITKMKATTPQQIKSCQKNSKCVLMLSGQGSQYPLMGRQLVESNEIFRATLQETLSKCDEYLQGDVSLWEILFNTEHYKLLQLTKHMQPIMFCFGYALAQLWLSLGISPDYYLGHSVGELVAGVLSGIMSIEDGLRLIVERGKAMENIAGLGALLAVQREIADDVLRKFKVCVATVNSPKQVVFAGPKSELDMALAFVKGQGKQGTFVNQMYPFHSNLIQESHLASLRKCLMGIKFRQGATPLVSNVTGQIINTFSEEYIVKHTVSPVKFLNCVETLQNEGVTVWIDAGPAAVLATFVKRIIQPAELAMHRIVQTCQEKDSDMKMLVQACLELEQFGFAISWHKVYGCDANDDASLIDFPVVHVDNVTKDELEVLEGHRLNGKIIVAGAYQIFKMDQVVKAHSAGLNFILKNVKFLKPWYIEDCREFRVYWNSDMTIELAVETDVVCSAKIEMKEGTLVTEKFREDGKIFDVLEFYEKLYKNGMQYESEFRGIDTATRSDKRCFSQLKPSKFPWTLIDSAMHSVTASIIIRRPDNYFLPVAMGEVALQNEKGFNMPNLQSQTMITSETDKFIQINVDLFADNEIICKIRNMTIVVMKSLPNTTTAPTPNVAESLETMKSEIEIVGFDITLPYNQMSTNTENWQFLKNNVVKQKLQNRSTKEENPLVALLDNDARYWDPEYFGIRPSEAQFLDPQQRLLLSSIAKLLDSLLISNLPSSTGVFIGCSTYEFSHVVYAHSNGDPRAEWGGGTSNSALAGRIAHWLKLTGPVQTVDTACSSSFYALTAACDALKSGKCNSAIVGAVNLVLHDMTTNVLQNAQMVIRDFCKVFDVDANGYKRSESVCSIFLSKATNDNSLAIISAWETGHNGSSSSLFTPNGTSQLEIMKKTTKNKSDIVEVETHCTGTKLGDPIELNAVSKLLKSECTINSIKSNVGHAEGASGLVSLCCHLLALKSQYKVPQLHLKCPTEVIRRNKMVCRFVGEEAILLKNEAVLINNFGFTGSNCSIMIKPKASNNEYSEALEVFYPMLISAHTANSLNQYIELFTAFVIHTSASLHDIMISLFHKKIHAHRHFFIYNFKRKTVVSSGTLFNGNSDERLIEILKQCSIFMKDGKIPFDRKRQFRNVDIPPLIFNNNLHWRLSPFLNEADENDPVTFKNIFYETALVERPSNNMDSIAKVVSIGRMDLIPKIEMDELSTFTNGIIIFHPITNSIEEYLKLAKLWSLINQEQNVLIIVCCFKNGTTHTEWTGTLRSLAAEKLISYKFVSIDSVETLKFEFNKKDVFECIFYDNNKRFVERLKQVFPKPRRHIDYESILLSGGTGGIGKSIIGALKPKEFVAITRRNVANEKGKRFVKSDVARFQSDSKFNHVFHLAGFVQNATHINVGRDSLEEMVLTKLQGAKNLTKCLLNTGKFVFSSSIACILGSYGQSNYTFVNGLVTSYLQVSGVKHNVIHWGPWKEVGMLARPECDEINRQITLNGWKPLTNSDALSVFHTEFMDSTGQIIVFDGDFDQIVDRQPHLANFLSGIVNERKKPKIAAKEVSFAAIFSDIVGINDMRSKVNIPFMDLGIDSLCMENLRHTLNTNFGLNLTVSDMFENATYYKLERYVINQIKTEVKRNVEHGMPTASVEEDNRVAVIGWSAEFSGSANIQEFWDNLMNGVLSTSRKGGGLKSPFGFDNKFFNITDADAKLLDPQIRKFIQHAYSALENSGYVEQRSKLKCGVFAGAEPSDYGEAKDQEDAMKKMFAMNMNNYLATYASFCLDLKGEAVSVYSACSTTLVAVANAVNTIQSGSIDYALVGAASIGDISSSLNGLDEGKKTIFAKSAICRPFDKNSEGIARGSGVGCLVLKSYRKAKADNDNIHFVITDFSVSNDGNSRASFMAPNPAGQLKCMTDVLNRLSQEQKERINFVECHATGTTLGDTIELSSLETAYNFMHKLKIGSCKANIGHAYAASGLASLIKCGMILKTGAIPPQINFTEFRDGSGKFFEVNTQTSEIPQDALIALDSFGIGGTNVHMIIELPVNGLQLEKESSSHNYILPISAASEYSLQQMKHLIKSYLHISNPKISYLCSTLLHNRESMLHRSYLRKESDSPWKFKFGNNNKASRVPPKIAFYFAPQGIQFSNILPEEFKNNLLFKKKIEELCLAMESIGVPHFKDILYHKNKNDRSIKNPEYAQTALFIQCMAIMEAMKGFIKPNLLIGHSVGEYAAASIGGVLKDSEMIHFLQKRSELIATTRRARMLMIWNYEKRLPEEVEVSAIVDCNTKCVVGPINEIDKFEKTLEHDFVKFREITTSYGFHSNMLNPISTDFKRICSCLEDTTPSIPILSSITGRIIPHFDAEYCQMHLTNPVNLDLVVNYLLESDIDIIVEIGPSGVLSNLLAKRNSKIVVIRTCGTEKNPESCLAECVGQLWNHGVDIRRWHRKLPVDGNAPGYCFEEKFFSNNVAQEHREKPESRFKLYSECWIESSVSKTYSNLVNFSLYNISELNKAVPVIVYPLYKSENIHKNFFEVEEFFKSSPKNDCIIFMAMDNSPSVHIVLGQLRCQQIVSQMAIKYVENFERIDIKKVVQMTANIDELYLRIKSDNVLKHNFTCLQRSLSINYKVCHPAIVFGANGYVGNLVSGILKSKNIDVLCFSRKSTKSCDICKIEDIQDLFEKLGMKKFSYVVNCVGVETKGSIKKTVEDQNMVLSAKTIGNVNILNSLERNAIEVDKFISFSSLSSIIPLLGNGDYASANCFVEALSAKKYPLIKQMLILSLPPLRGSRMYENSITSTKEMLKEMTMNEEEFSKILKMSFDSDLSGLVHVCSENPLDLAVKSVKYHQADYQYENEQGNGEPSIYMNQEQIKDIIKKVWKETLGLSQEISDLSNFFSLGGDSLSALQVVWQVYKQLGKTIEVDELFSNPKLQEFAEIVMKSTTKNNNSCTSDSITDYDSIPLTHSQTQMFMLRQVDTTSRYNVIFKITIDYDPQFCWESLKLSLLSLIAYQNSYRSFFQNSSPPHQTVCSLTESFHNLDDRCQLIDAINDEQNHSFEIGKMTPLRVRIAEDHRKRRIHIVFNQHHILTDGWSMTVLADTINNLYNAYEGRNEFPVKSQHTISKLAIKEENEKLNLSNVIDEASQYYKNMDHTVIPFDKTGCFEENHKRLTKVIPSKLWNNLIQLSKQYNTTTYHIALTIFCDCVRSFTGYSDLLFAYAHSGRNVENSELIGYLMNNILFNVSIPHKKNDFCEIFEIVSKSLAISRKFSKVPFHRIVEKNRFLNSIHIYFNFRQKLDYPAVSILGAKCEIEHISLNNAFSFSFTIDETPSGALITVDYDSSRYTKSTINLFSDHFMKKLNYERKNNKSVRIQQADYPTLSFQIDLLSSWKLFSESAFLNSSNNISYAEFAEKIGNIAPRVQKQSQVLRAVSIREDDIIGVVSNTLPVEILACFLLGVPFAPIDPLWPKDRQLFVKEKVNMLFQQEDCTNSKIRTFSTSTKYGSMYAIFTSGSTGVPKGVVMSKQSVFSFITSTTKQCLFRSGLRVLDSVKQVFDVSISNIFGSVLNGGVLISSEHSTTITDELRMCQYAFLPASVFNGFTSETMKRLENLEILTIGGETVSDVTIQAALKCFPKLQVVQIYGPTETCIWSLTNKCKKETINVGSILGEPMENESYTVDNNYIRGNLKIRGISLARGYITSNPVGNPFSESYSTGDVVDLKSGTIRFIGRTDSQIKWKGVRVDLAVLEREMLTCLDVLQIALVYSNQMLIAFLVGLKQTSKLQHADIIQKLKENSQTPDHFVQIDKVPLNSSSKIEKTLLLQAFENVQKSYKREMVPMENSLEEKITKISSEILGRKTNITDNFTEVGGNSLLSIQFAHRLTEELKFEVKAHEIIQSSNLKEFSYNLASSIQKPTSSMPNVITKLREVPNSTFNIYLVHAIGGTIYPYYSFLQIFPKNISLYGIEFDVKYPSGDLRELSHFYAKEIAAHAKDKRLFVIGHSMGGIMSREIVAELKLFNYEVPFVMLFDSWVLRSNELNIEEIKKFITYVFSGLPDSEHRIEKAIKLAQLLREYKTSVSDTKLYLFKSKQLGDAAFKKAVRTDLNEELSRSMTCNGFDELSLQPIDTYLIDGDHESCLKVENLNKVKEFILAPFKPYLDQA